MLHNFLAPREVGDISYDGHEITLDSLMDEKWSALTGRASLVPTHKVDRLEKIFQTEANDDDEVASLKLQVKSLDKSDEPVGTLPVNQQLTIPVPKRLTIWERIFTPSQQGEKYKHPAIEISAKPCMCRIIDGLIFEAIQLENINERGKVVYEIYTTEQSYCHRLLFNRN